jgi:hypothetical protein
MRSDMKKVLTERPRHGRFFSYHDFRQRDSRGDYDLLPSYQGMRRPYRLNWGDCKEFSDLLGPLIRYLHGCVGRRWDDVWSEICQQVDSTSVTGRHLRSHVESEVEQNCSVEDGVVYARPRRWRPVTAISGLYVHPISGLLCDGGRRTYGRDRDTEYTSLDGCTYRKKGQVLISSSGPARRVIEHGKKEAACFNGIWHWIIFAVVPPPRRVVDLDSTGARRVRFLNHACTDIVTRQAVTRGHYRAGKRQMSSADLRRNGLENEAG